LPGQINHRSPVNHLLILLALWIQFKYCWRSSKSYGLQSKRNDADDADDMRRRRRRRSDTSL